MRGAGIHAEQVVLYRMSKLTATTAGLKDVPEQVKAAADDVFSNLPDAVGKQAHVQ